MTDEYEMEYTREDEHLERISELEEENAELKAQIEKMKCCYNCQKDCGSIDRRICFDNSFKDWELRN